VLAACNGVSPSSLAHSFMSLKLEKKLLFTLKPVWSVSCWSAAICWLPATWPQPPGSSCTLFSKP
jgi:hypothetical protein